MSHQNEASPKNSHVCVHKGWGEERLANPTNNWGNTMTTSITADGFADRPAFLSKERIIAKPGFNRWLVPPAALAIHLCIGMAYGFSVFWLPLSKAPASPKPWLARRT